MVTSCKEFQVKNGTTKKELKSSDAIDFSKTKNGESKSRIIIKDKETGETIYVNKVTGLFKMRIADITGILKILYKDNRFQGTLLFKKLGKGKPYLLKNLKVNNKKIYFVRSVTTKEELEKHGLSSYFKQEFHGIFSNDSKRIKGFYNQTGVIIRWIADRIDK